MFSTLRIAWRNLGRSKRRTAIAIAAIALGQFTLVFVNCMMAGSFEAMLQTLTGPLVGHVQVHHKDWKEERAVDLYIDNLSQVEAEIKALPDETTISPRVYAMVLSASGEKSDKPADAEPAMIVGVDIAGENVKGGLLEDLDPGDVPDAQSVVLGKVLANRLGLKPGQQIAVMGQDADGFPVSGLFEVKGIVRAKIEVVSRLGVVMPLTNAQELLGLADQAHEIIIRGDDHRKAEELTAAIEVLPSLEGTDVKSWRKAVPELVRLIDMKVWFDLIFLVILFVAAAAGIANTMMMSTFERTHEFGMLLAVGARPGRVVRMILIESVILGLVGVAIGSILGTVLVLITGHYGLDYSALATNLAEDVTYKGMNISYVIYPKFELRHIMFGVVAVTLTSVLASLWPAAISARLEPVEAMRS